MYSPHGLPASALGNSQKTATLFQEIHVQKIINGKKYDTATADYIASYDNNHERGDLHSVDESLYRTQDGEFFLHGFGGAATDYAKPTGANNWSAAEGIIVLTPEEALAWMEGCDVDAETIEQHFKLSMA